MNNCFFNHPRPIFCPFVNLDCTENTIINPVLGGDFAFFNNTLGGTFAPSSIIPVTLNNMSGNTIIPSGTGGVYLSAGTYEINYFVGGLVPASGTISILLRLNGAVVDGSVIDGTQTIGNAVSLSRTLVITVTQDSILELINNSSDNTIYTFASLFIKRL